MKIKTTLVKSSFSVPRHYHLSLLIAETTAEILILIRMDAYVRQNS